MTYRVAHKKKEKYFYTTARLIRRYMIKFSCSDDYNLRQLDM